MCISVLNGLAAADDGWPLAPSGVYMRHHQQAAASIRAVVDQIERVEAYFARYPDDVATFETMAAEIGRLMHLSDAAIVRFRNTRDCQGAA